MNNLEKIRKFLDEHHIVYCTAVDFKRSKIIIPYEDIVISFTSFMDETIVHMEVDGKEYARINLTVDKAIRYLYNLFCPGELEPDK